MAVLAKQSTIETTSSASVCDVCVHQVDAHDPIALRYCRATLSAATARGCICRPVA